MEHDSHQCLTFGLDGESFALSISRVREVLEMTDITKVPRMPDFMRGVINLRGHAVPVVDMRRKFGMDRADDTVDTCIIIVETAYAEESVILGALVDSVSEVVEFAADALDPAPRMGTTIKADFIEGIGKKDGAFVTVLDVARVFSEQELSALGAKREDAGAKPKQGGDAAQATA